MYLLGSRPRAPAVEFMVAQGTAGIIKFFKGSVRCLLY